MINTNDQCKGSNKSEQELVQNRFTGPDYVKYHYHNDRLVQNIERVYGFVYIILNGMFPVQVPFGVPDGGEDPAPGRKGI
jgi:hypothetical protein